MKTYALVGHFDKKLEDEMIEIWKELSDKSITDYGFAYKERLPHVTFVDLQAQSDTEIIELLKTVKSKNIDIKLNSISNFIGTSTLCYSIFPSEELIRLHRELENKFDKYIPDDSYYRRNKWTPHSTIASRLNQEDIANTYSVITNRDCNDGVINKLVLLEIQSATEVYNIFELEL